MPAAKTPAASTPVTPKKKNKQSAGKKKNKVQKETDNPGQPGLDLPMVVKDILDSNFFVAFDVIAPSLERCWQQRLHMLCRRARVDRGQEACVETELGFGGSDPVARLTCARLRSVQ